MRKLITRIALVGATIAAMIAAALGAGPAYAATADGSPVAVSATVGQSISLGGLAATIVFPQGTPGQTVTNPTAEGYSVSSNDQSGYTLSIAPGAGTFGGIPNSALSVIEKTTAPGTYTFAGSAPLVINATHAATTDGGDTYNESWSLAIPQDAAAATYSETFVYTVLGS